jgi:hypothetical protein
MVGKHAPNEDRRTGLIQSACDDGPTGAERHCDDGCRDEVCNRSDHGKPPPELSERTEQILASRDWLSPMKSAS